MVSLCVAGQQSLQVIEQWTLERGSRPWTSQECWGAGEGAEVGVGGTEKVSGETLHVLIEKRGGARPLRPEKRFL